MYVCKQLAQMSQWEVKPVISQPQVWCQTTTMPHSKIMNIDTDNTQLSLDATRRNVCLCGYNIHTSVVLIYTNDLDLWPCKLFTWRIFVASFFEIPPIKYRAITSREIGVNGQQDRLTENRQWMDRHLDEWLENIMPLPLAVHSEGTKSTKDFKTPKDQRTLLISEHSMLLAGSISGRPHGKWWWCHDIGYPLLAAEHSLCKAPWSGTPCWMTSAHRKTMSPLDSAWKPGFSLATSVLSALETLWQ